MRLAVASVLLVCNAYGGIAAAGAARLTAPTPTLSDDARAFANVAFTDAPLPTPWGRLAPKMHWVGGADDSPAAALLRRQATVIASCGSVLGWTGTCK